MQARQGISRTGRQGLAVAVALLLALAWHPLFRLAGQLILALILTAIALPLCKQLEKRWHRAFAALMSIALLILALIGTIALFVPPIVGQIRLLIAQAPTFFQQLQDMWRRLRQQEWLSALGVDRDLPLQWINRAAAWIGESLPGLINGMAAGIDMLSRAFLSPLLAYYFLRDRETFAYQLSLWIPSRHRKRTLAALQGMRREAGSYIRGQLLISLAVGVLTAAGLLLVGIPAWLVLGILMGLCELIPYVGPFIGGVPIAVFSLPLGMSTTLWALGVTVAVQQIEGFFLSPFLMAGATGLHPVYVVLLLSAGGMIGGLPGMMAALPAFLCVRGGVRVFLKHENP
ncbi:MAG: AI-2E family transporter [Clostridia bacterium]|nr:AI-2E family transporter [Clostridia bacterium]